MQGKPRPSPHWPARSDNFARAPGAFPCTFRIRMRDGHEFSADVCAPVAVSAIVMEKFHAALSGILPREARQGIVDAIMELHHSPSMAALDAAITAGEIG